MGRKSTREDKSIFQLSRERAGLTRMQAGDIMGFVTEDRIEKIEGYKTEARPDEVLEMAKCYRDESLCNEFCSKECPIGKQYVPEIKNKELAQVAVEIVSSVITLNTKKDSFIQIAAEENPEVDIDTLTELEKDLTRLSGSIDSLSLWLRKKANGAAVK